MLWFQARLCQWSSYLLLENVCAEKCPQNHLLYMVLKEMLGIWGLRTDGHHPRTSCFKTQEVVFLQAAQPFSSRYNPCFSRIFKE